MTECFGHLMSVALEPWRLILGSRRGGGEVHLSAGGGFEQQTLWQMLEFHEGLGGWLVGCLAGWMAGGLTGPPNTSKTRTPNTKVRQTCEPLA